MVAEWSVLTPEMSFLRVMRICRIGGIIRHMESTARRVLVVDDQAVIRELFRLLLVDDERFAPVLLASDRRAALELLDEHQPHVVLLDVDLGADDGLSLVPEVRQRVPGAAVVVFSSATRATPHLVAASGADGFVEKGTDVDEVVELLLEVVPRRVVDLTATEVVAHAP